MRLRLLAPITAGTTLLVLSLLTVPASASGTSGTAAMASGHVAIYDQGRRVQTISNPPAHRCVPVVQVRVPRVVNQSSARIELHRTRNCSQRAVGIVAPRRSDGIAGLRAIKALV